MTTTHTQPAGCDLDSEQKLFEGELTGQWDFETHTNATGDIRYTDTDTEMAFIGWLAARRAAARAAQGAGTAPVGVVDPERAKWTTKQWYEHVGAWETPEGHVSFDSVMAVRAMLLLFQRAMIATHPAPVSTAAATTASGSETLEQVAEKLEQQHTWITNVAAANIVRSFIAPSRAADGQQGASLTDLIGPQRWSKEAEMMESWAHIGQQGASRAALDVETLWEVHGVVKNAGSTRLAHKIADHIAALACNQPAQGAAQVEVEAARDAVQDPIRELVACHAELLEENAYTYFELAYTRRTEWMARLCTNSRESDPDRQVLARGQGSTPEEACAAALAAKRGGASD